MERPRTTEGEETQGKATTEGGLGGGVGVEQGADGENRGGGRSGLASSSSTGGVDTSTSAKPESSSATMAHPRL